MTEFEQYIISELVEIKKVLIDIWAESSHTAIDTHNINDFLIYDTPPCPDHFDIFDSRCNRCTWKDICVKESKDE